MPICWELHARETTLWLKKKFCTLRDDQPKRGRNAALAVEERYMTAGHARAHAEENNL